MTYDVASPALNIPVVDVIATCAVYNMEYPVSGDHTVTMGFK